MLYPVKNTIQVVAFYLTIVHTIRMCDCLQCYACSGRDQCGISFSPNSSTTQRIESQGDGFFDVCTIFVNPAGITTRNLTLSYECRSSPNQFCCKEDWCNSLPAPPLPALTSRICKIDRCLSHNDNCNDTFYMATLSSATESCIGTWETLDQTVKQSYKKHCLPGYNAMVIDEHATLEEYFCCNSPECNQQAMSPKLAINCFTCDSRITGLAGCSILNASSPCVYKSGSSDSSEACATIIGFNGQDRFTHVSYPDFVIRTFIQDCKNQSLGIVSYGGATFQGLINCCWKNFCNVENLDTIVAPEIVTNKTPENKSGKSLLVSIVIVIIVILCSVSLTYVGWIIYRSRYRRSDSRYYELSGIRDNDLYDEDTNLNSSPYFVIQNPTFSNDHSF